MQRATAKTPPGEAGFSVGGEAWGRFGCKTFEPAESSKETHGVAGNGTRELRPSQGRPNTMLQALLSAIVDLVLSVAWGAIVRLLGLENVVEIATAILGLSCIVIGFTVFLLGY